jgi:hypothetical protein
MKSFKPSKELLTAVLKTEIEDSVTEGNTIWPLEFNSWRKGEMQLCNAKKYPRGINIYELIHMMKEWAKENNHNIASIFFDMGEWLAWEPMVYETKDQMRAQGFYASSEPEAVTKACEWILKEDKK